MIKIAVLCAILACAATVDYVCINGAPDSAGAATTIDCSETEAADAMCKGPISPAVANTTVEYGCGACADDTAASCTDCRGDTTTKCNTYVIPTYTWTCKNLTATDTDIDCPANTMDNIHCFGPMESYTATDDDAGRVLAAGGCGECPVAYTAEECEDCDYQNCNSAAAALISFLAPLLALLFWLH